MKALTAVLLAASLHIGVTLGLTCYQCSEVSSVGHCHVLTTCSHGDHCFLKEFVTEANEVRYTAGCAPRSECSHGVDNDHNGAWRKACCTSCQLNGCNRNPCKSLYHCYQYKGVTSPHDFHIGEPCNLDQSCYLEVYEEAGTLKYYGGCISNTECHIDGHPNHAQTQPGLPGHPGNKRCLECCNRHYCNSGLCKNTQPAQHPVTQSPVDVWCNSCHDVDATDGCPAFKCQPGEQCYLTASSQHGRIVYTAGCTRSDQCKPFSPSTSGDNVCIACCRNNFCNSRLCDDQVHKYLEMHTDVMIGQTSPSVAASTAVPLPRCYQCYDLRVDDRGAVEPCFNTVSCSASSDRCSTVYRQEGTILTVDMDCQENLPCKQDRSPTQLCGSCCDGDTCNGDLDCRTETASSTVLQTTSPKTPVTTSATTLGSTQSTTPRYYKGVQCAICNGPLCGVSPAEESVAVCPDNLAPFCLNKINNDANGNKHIRKRCGGLHECNEKWVKESSNKTECVNFDPSSIYTGDFECTFCCTTSNCNTKIYPDAFTLF